MNLGLWLQSTSEIFHSFLVLLSLSNTSDFLANLVCKVAMELRTVTSSK